MNYKAPNNKIHVIDSVEHEYLLPAGCVQITDEEADAIREAEAALQPVVIPATVTMRQARLALLQAGKLVDVNAAIASMAGATGEAARIEWEYSQEVHRDKALVKSLAPVLGMTDAQLDSLFIAAAAF
jgi:hypothetical protein